MNLASLKLLLAALWLLPGIVFLAFEWSGGPVVAVPIGGRRIPLAWPFIVIGLFNLARWGASRPSQPPDWIERRRHRNDQ
jgi:hypothetical protein